MKTWYLPRDYDLDGRCPQRRVVKDKRFDGAEISEAEVDGTYYLIIDERALVADLDPGDELNQPAIDTAITVLGFDGPAERARYLDGLV